VAACTHGKGTCQEQTGQFLGITRASLGWRKNSLRNQQLMLFTRRVLYNSRAESLEAN
jgi:hypothetical protein